MAFYIVCCCHLKMLRLHIYVPVDVLNKLLPHVYKRRSEACIQIAANVYTGVRFTCVSSVACLLHLISSVMVSVSLGDLPMVWIHVQQV